MSDWRLIADATSAPLAAFVIAAYATDSAVEVVRGGARDSVTAMLTRIDQSVIGEVLGKELLGRVSGLSYSMKERLDERSIRFTSLELWLRDQSGVVALLEVKGDEMLDNTLRPMRQGYPGSVPSAVVGWLRDRIVAYERG